MAKLKLIRALAFFTAIAGLLTAIGWIFDIGFLRDTLSGLIPMKFTTAVCFIAGGIVLYSVAEEKKESSFVVQVILPSAILLILLPRKRGEANLTIPCWLGDMDSNHDTGLQRPMSYR